MYRHPHQPPKAAYSLAVVVTVMVGLLVFLWSLPARPQEDGWRGHEEYHGVYQGWKQNGTGTSCCNNQDCHPAQARRRSDNDYPWEVFERGVWLPVPKDKIIHNASPDGDPHVCVSWRMSKEEAVEEQKASVLCFVAPNEV